MIAGKMIQLLTFQMGSEVFAIDVARIREVLDWVIVTPLPKTPAWICGVANLRGSVLPVIDLKRRLDMGKTERSKSSCILVLELCLEGEDVIAGVLVDAVRAVIDMEAGQIEPPPRFGCKFADGTYVRGLGRHEGAIFAILDTEKLFAITEASAPIDGDPAGEVDGTQPAAMKGVVIAGRSA
jgi:chemotaxis signal transduction protein